MTVHCGNASYIGLWCCDILARSPVVVTLFSDSCVLCEFSRLLTLVSCAYHLVGQWDSRPWLPLSILQYVCEAETLSPYQTSAVEEKLQL